MRLINLWYINIFGGACNITMREHSLSAPEAVQVCDATMLSKVITAWYQIKVL